MTGWFKKQQNNKDKILILTLKNSNNKSIKLVINLNNLYLLGFINNQNQYFYFDYELLKKIQQKNENEITELKKIKTDLEKLNKLIKEKTKDKTEEENLEWEIIEKLNKLKELDKLNKELIEARKTKNNIQINETKQKIEKLKEEIFIVIHKINYTNNIKYLDSKIENLQGEGLKTEEIKTKYKSRRKIQLLKD